MTVDTLPADAPSIDTADEGPRGGAPAPSTDVAAAEKPAGRKAAGKKTKTL